MPTQTFLNLSEEKRTRFVAIALDEFANHDYAAASVSKIVARAGIAKGSLYQYFQDKRALFLYLLDVANQTLLAAVTQSSSAGGGDAPPDLDFFQRLRNWMSATVQAAMSYPLHARLLVRAHTSPLPFRAEVIEQARQTRYLFLRDMLQQGMRQGEIDPGLDLDITARLLDSLIAGISQTVMERLQIDPRRLLAGGMAQFENPLLETIFDRYIQVIQFGLARKE